MLNFQESFWLYIGHVLSRICIKIPGSKNSSHIWNIISSVLDWYWANTLLCLLKIFILLKEKSSVGRLKQLSVGRPTHIPVVWDDRNDRKNRALTTEVANNLPAASEDSCFLVYHLYDSNNAVGSEGHNRVQGPVVRTVDNFIQRINPYQVVKFARSPIKIKNVPILSAVKWFIRWI